MDEANQKAQSCTVLLSIMGNSRVDQNQCLRKVDSKKSWMRAISSVFTYIAQHQIGVNMEDAFEAYRETQDVLKFVDCPDNIVVDPLNMFGTFNIKGSMNSIDCEGQMLNVERKLKQGLSTSLEVKRERVDNLVKDLMNSFSGASNSVMTRLKECRSNNELGEMLRTLVVHVIVSCLLEAPDVIVKCTRQWAQNLDEEKIEGAIEVAGKVSGLLEKLAKEGEDIEAAA